MLSKFSIKKPFTILVAVIIILVFGVISFMKMTPDLFPKIDTPFVIVMTTYPGASPEEIESQITEPMEQQFATLTNLKNVNSISSANYSVVQMEFSDKVNMDAISVDIRDKIDQVKGILPENASTPVVMKINLDMMPVVIATVGIKDKTPGEVSEFTKENLENPLKGVEGVASLSTMGMVEDNIQIVLSQEKIDEINEEISAAVAGQMASAKSQIKDGIDAAKDGKDQIKDGKDAIVDGQNQATQQIASTKARLESNIAQLEMLKANGDAITALYNQYQAAVASGNEMLIQQIEAAITASEFKTVQGLEAVYNQLQTVDETIKALEEALDELEGVDVNTSFELGTKYSDLAAAEIAVDQTVNQLQNALEEISSSEEAALASADMTGVINE